jgi:hypothetical protein
MVPSSPRALFSLSHPSEHSKYAFDSKERRKTFPPRLQLNEKSSTKKKTELGRKIINSPVAHKLLNILLNTFLIAFFLLALLAPLHGEQQKVQRFQSK